MHIIDILNRIKANSSYWVKLITASDQEIKEIASAIIKYYEPNSKDALLDLSVEDVELLQSQKYQAELVKGAANKTSVKTYIMSLGRAYRTQGEERRIKPKLILISKPQYKLLTPEMQRILKEKFNSAISVCDKLGEEYGPRSNRCLSYSFCKFITENLEARLTAKSFVFDDDKSSMAKQEYVLYCAFGYKIPAKILRLYIEKNFENININSVSTIVTDLSKEVQTYLKELANSHIWEILKSTPHVSHNLHSDYGDQIYLNAVKQSSGITLQFTNWYISARIYSFINIYAIVLIQQFSGNTLTTRLEQLFEVKLNKFIEWAPYRDGRNGVKYDLFRQIRNKSNNVDVLALFYKKAKDVKPNNLYDILCTAIRNGEIWVVDAVVKSGLDFNQSFSLPYGQLLKEITPLHYACYKGEPHVVTKMMEMEGVGFNVTSKAGMTPFMFLCGRFCFDPKVIIKFLMDERCKIPVSYIADQRVNKDITVFINGFIEHLERQKECQTLGKLFKCIGDQLDEVSKANKEEALWYKRLKVSIAKRIEPEQVMELLKSKKWDTAILDDYVRTLKEVAMLLVSKHRDYSIANKLDKLLGFLSGYTEIMPLDDDYYNVLAICEFIEFNIPVEKARSKRERTPTKSGDLDTEAFEQKFNANQAEIGRLLPWTKKVRLSLEESVSESPKVMGPQKS